MLIYLYNVSSSLGHMIGGGSDVHLDELTLFWPSFYFNIFSFNAKFSVDGMPNDSLN